jgi:hypothetical protein
MYYEKIIINWFEFRKYKIQCRQSLGLSLIACNTSLAKVSTVLPNRQAASVVI